MSASTLLDVELTEHGALAAAWPAVGARPGLPAGASAHLERVRATAPALDLLAALAASMLLGAPGLMPVVLAIACATTLAVRGAYAPRVRPALLEAVTPRLLAATTAAAVAAGWRVYAEGAAPPRLALLLALVAVVTGALIVAWSGVVAIHQLAWRTYGRAPAIVIGAGRVAGQVHRRLERDAACGLRPVAFLDDAPDAIGAGGFADLEHIAARHGARDVIVAFSAEPDERVARVVRNAERLGMRIWVVPRFFDVVNQRATYEAIAGMPLVGLRRVAREDWRFALKHALDKVVAALALLAVAPVLAACALGVRLSSPGPILFRQRRVGCDGREFSILKFRSMCPGGATTAAGLRHEAQTAPGGVEGEDRRTRFGAFLRRTSLDELPQLVNVLRGEMSLVGPRPERPEFVAAFTELDRYAERHRVRSGITGWAQVHGLRGKTSLADRVAYDNHYIEHWSLGLDLRTLMLTVLAVFRSAE